MNRLESQKYDLAFVTRETRRNEPTEVRDDVKEGNEQGIRESRDTALASQKVPLKTLEFIPTLNVVCLGKLTACLLAASDRNDYAIIMTLLVGNVRVARSFCCLKK